MTHRVINTDCRFSLFPETLQRRKQNVGLPVLHSYYISTAFVPCTLIFVLIKPKLQKHHKSYFKGGKQTAEPLKAVRHERWLYRVVYRVSL